MSTAWFDWDKDDFAILPSFNGGFRGRSFVHAGTELISAAIRSVSPTRLLAHVQAAARSVSPVRLLRNTTGPGPGAAVSGGEDKTEGAVISVTAAPADTTSSTKSSPASVIPTALAGSLSSLPAQVPRVPVSGATTHVPVVPALPKPSSTSSQQLGTSAAGAVPSAIVMQPAASSLASSSVQQLPASTAPLLSRPVASGAQTAVGIPPFSAPPPTSRRPRDGNSVSGRPPSHILQRETNLSPTLKSLPPVLPPQAPSLGHYAMRPAEHSAPSSGAADKPGTSSKASALSAPKGRGAGILNAAGDSGGAESRGSSASKKALGRAVVVDSAASSQAVVLSHLNSSSAAANEMRGGEISVQAKVRLPCFSVRPQTSTLTPRCGPCPCSCTQ